MKQEVKTQCKICGNNIDLESPHFILTFAQEIIEKDTKKILGSTEAAKICEDCGQEGLPSVLWNLKLIREADAELKQKMELVKKSVNMEELMMEYGIYGEKVGVDNQYLATCPFHNQEASFLIDADRKEYFCFCEGLRGDLFSFVMNYERDVNKKHTTLKQAVDYLLGKVPAP
jgi:hypothetical protein